MKRPKKEKKGGIEQRWPILQTDVSQTQNIERHYLSWLERNRKLHLFRGTKPLVYAWAGPRAALGPPPCLMSCWEKPPDLHELQQEQLSVLLLVFETNVLLMGHHSTVVLHAVIHSTRAVILLWEETGVAHKPSHNLYSQH